jgi:hypothetical protein
VAATGLLASHHQSHRRLSSSGRASQTPFPLPCCYVRLSRLIDSCASVRVNRCIFHAYARANRSHRHICLSPLKFFLLHGVCICTYIDCCLPENKRERERKVLFHLRPALTWLFLPDANCWYQPIENARAKETDACQLLAFLCFGCFRVSIRWVS